MPQPYDYSSALTPATGLMPDIGANFQKALELQNGVQKSQLYQSEIDKNKQQTAGLAASQARALEVQKAAGELATNPSVNGIIATATKFPELTDHYQKIVGTLQGQQKESRIAQASQVYAALQAGQPDVAVKLLDDQAAAHDNNPDGKDNAQSARVMSGLIKASPKTAQATVGLFLSAAMGADKFGETFNKLQQDRRDTALEPSVLSEAQSKAQEYAVKAKYAESNAVQDLAKKGWDIKKIASDIDVAEYNKKIAMMDIRVKQANSDTERKRYELQKSEFEYKRDNEIRGKVAEATNVRTTIDNLLNTADQVIAVHERTPDVVANAHGPVSARLPTLRQSTANYEVLVEQLGSQSFISQVQALKTASATGATGLGQLTEKEGDKVEKALQSLTLKQDPAQMYEAVKELQRVMLKMRKNVSTKFGIPDTIPDTPAVVKTNGARGPGGTPMSTDDILRELGVLGRPN
jgi:hypothetical protein